METIHFTTTISKSGTISIPDGRTLINREVEVIITPKIKNINTLSNKAKDFINKWVVLLICQKRKIRDIII